MAIVISETASRDTVGALHDALVRLHRLPNKTSKLTSGAFGRAKEKLHSASQVLRHSPVPTKHPLWYRSDRVFESPHDKAKRIKEELVAAGATFYGLLKSESRYLPRVLHDNEHIEAIVYGQHESSSAMLVATNERIIYLDKKPMVVLIDELTYEVVSGIEFDIHTLFATVILHTPVRNYNFRFVNLHCGEKFAQHIEAQRLLHEEAEHALLRQENYRARRNRPVYELEDMAGYYWLPFDEEERQRVQTGVT